MLQAIPVVLAAGATPPTMTFVVQFFTGEFIQYALLFFVLALVAAVVGARRVAGVSMAIAKWFIILFLVLAVLSIVF